MFFSVVPFNSFLADFWSVIRGFTVIFSSYGCCRIRNWLSLSDLDDRVPESSGSGWLVEVKLFALCAQIDICPHFTCLPPRHSSRTHDRWPCRIIIARGTVKPTPFSCLTSVAHLRLRPPATLPWMQFLAIFSFLSILLIYWSYLKLLKSPVQIHFLQSNGFSKYSNRLTDLGLFNKESTNSSNSVHPKLDSLDHLHFQKNSVT